MYSYFFCFFSKNSSVCFSQNSWIQMSNFGGGVRNSAVSFSIGSKGYVGTGSPNNTGLNLQNDFWEFDPSTNIWTQKANYGGGPRLGAVCFSIGTKGYIGLGSDANMIYRDFWEYDPFTNIWTQMADFPGSLRHAAVGFSIGTKGYIGTGNAPTGGALQDFWEYDPSSDSWSQKSNFGGIARTEAVGFSIGNHGYIGTGWIPNGISLQDFWEYDPTLDTWNQKSSFGGNQESLQLVSRLDLKDTLELDWMDRFQEISGNTTKQMIHGRKNKLWGPWKI
ncbi:MAG: galactose oxidase [Bacteroidetes bacterium]|nr:galactose oxidase [Bacteroidota bacterium]